MGVENWQARWHAPQKPQEKRGFSRQIVRATSRKKWHALARSLPRHAGNRLAAGGRRGGCLAPHCPLCGCGGKRGMHGTAWPAGGPERTLVRRRNKPFVPASLAPPTIDHSL